MARTPSQAYVLHSKIVYTFCCAAALLSPCVPRLASAGSPECNGITDPSISCDIVQPPGMTTPGAPQLPGFSRRNTESGNLVTQIPLSEPLVISHSSQSVELQNGKPRENEGFGPGFTVVGRLTQTGSNSILRRTADGALVTYSRTTSSGPFLSADRVFGDTTQLVATSGGFELQMPDGSRYLYTYAVGGSYYPSRTIDSLGRETIYTYNGKILTQVKDVSLNRITSLTVGSNGLVSDVTDFNALKTKLSYKDGQLFSVTYPDGKGYTLTYDQDGLGYVTQLTTPDNTTETYAYYQFGILRAIGQEDRLTTFAYTPTEVATESSAGDSTLQFGRTKFSGGHPTESWTGDGSLGQPAVLTAKSTYSEHRLTGSVDSFGRTTKLFYNLDSSCQTASGTAEQSPLPTCIVSPDGTTTQTYRDWSLFGAPTKVVVTGPAGVSPIVSTFQYAGPGRLSIARTTRDGIETGRQEITYQGLLPTSTTVTGLTKVLAFDGTIKGRPAKLLTAGGSQIESQFSPLGVLTSRTIDGVTVTSQYDEAGSGQATYSATGADIIASGHSNFDATRSDGLIKGVGDQTALSLGDDPGVTFAANAVEGQIRARMKPEFTTKPLQERLENAPLSEASQLVPAAAFSWNSSTDVGATGLVGNMKSQLRSGAGASSWQTESNESWSTTDNSESSSSSSGYK